jgi:hypothetical protein
MACEHFFLVPQLLLRGDKTLAAKVGELCLGPFSVTVTITTCERVVYKSFGHGVR